MLIAMHVEFVCIIADVLTLVKSFGELEEFARDDEKKHKLRMVLCDLRFVVIG